MHVVIRHSVSDPAKWDRSAKNIMAMIEQHQLPAGLKPLEYLPSVDGRNADCVWATESLEALQAFIERETAGARNEYFEVKEEAAVGLPRRRTYRRRARLSRSRFRFPTESCARRRGRPAQRIRAGGLNYQHAVGVLSRIRPFPERRDEPFPSRLARGCFLQTIIPNCRCLNYLRSGDCLPPFACLSFLNLGIGYRRVPLGNGGSSGLRGCR